MQIFYSLGIHIYSLLITIAAILGNQKAKHWVDGRSDWEQKLKNALPNNAKVIWIHAASLGEFEQGRPLIEKIKKEDPNLFILLTFFSPSGYEIRKQFELADYVSYLPADTTYNAKKFIDMVTPQVAIFIKYEFWFNYLNQLKQQQIKTILISGIFRNSQHFFQFYGGWFRSRLKAFDHFYLQDENSKELLGSIGFRNTSVVGDTRLDRVQTVSEQEFSDFRLDTFSRNSKLIVIGSAWSQEMEFAIKFCLADNSVKLIIAPHEINMEELESVKKRFEDGCKLWSEVSDNQDLSDERVMIINQVGLLSKLYRFGDIAFIGGGFGKGIHNILEAAVYGKPILFGPNHTKFNEASELLKRGGAFEVSSFEEFKSKVNYLLTNFEAYKQAAFAAAAYVKEKSGATNRIYAENFKN